MPNVSRTLYLRTTPMEGETMLTDVRPANNVLPVFLSGKYKLGDVNKDGCISIADVTALVNIILGKDSTEPYVYEHEAADLNQDGNISIADVTSLVNIILGR